MSTLPKWTEDRTDALRVFVGDESPVSQETVAEAAESLDTTARSIASKLRKEGFEVEKSNANKVSDFSSELTATLRNFVEGNSGAYTYGEIAAAFANGAFSAKQIQGKLLSMELHSFVKATPKPVTIRKYSESEEATFVKLVKQGASVEEIATALGREIPSVRGKALSLLRSKVIDAIPRQAESTAVTKTDPLTDLGDVSGMTVEEIAAAIEHTPRGVKTMLTRRGLTVSDYDGAAKKAKASSKA